MNSKQQVTQRTCRSGVPGKVLREWVEIFVDGRLVMTFEQSGSGHDPQPKKPRRSPLNRGLKP